MGRKYQYTYVLCVLLNTPDWGESLRFSATAKPYEVSTELNNASSSGSFWLCCCCWNIALALDLDEADIGDDLNNIEARAGGGAGDDLHNLNNLPPALGGGGGAPNKLFDKLSDLVDILTTGTGAGAGGGGGGGTDAENVGGGGTPSAGTDKTILWL